MSKVLSFVVAGLLALPVFAGELDQPHQPGNVSATTQTIVVRVNQQTGVVEKADSRDLISAESLKNPKQAAALRFEKVGAEKIRSELDQEAGASSWYWYCPSYYSYPTYSNYYYNTGFYYYGNWYTSYYYYSYGYYNYYYYQPYYGRGDFDDYGDVFR